MNTQQPPQAEHQLSILQQFDKLPASACVRLPVVRAVTGCSAATIWRMAKDGRLTTRKLGAKTTGFTVGSIRALCGE